MKLTLVASSRISTSPGPGRRRGRAVNSKESRSPGRARCRATRSCAWSTTARRRSPSASGVLRSRARWRVPSRWAISSCSSGQPRSSAATSVTGVPSSMSRMPGRSSACS